jgi:hypothetical protein
MLWVGTGMMPANHSGATRSDINNIGSFSGLMTVSPSDKDASGIPAGDLATARKFGERIVEALALLK